MWTAVVYLTLFIFYFVYLKYVHFQASGCCSNRISLYMSSDNKDLFLKLQREMRQNRYMCATVANNNTVNYVSLMTMYLYIFILRESLNEHGIIKTCWL